MIPAARSDSINALQLTRPTCRVRDTAARLLVAGYWGLPDLAGSIVLVCSDMTIVARDHRRWLPWLAGALVVGSATVVAGLRGNSTAKPATSPRTPPTAPAPAPPEPVPPEVRRRAWPVSAGLLLADLAGLAGTVLVEYIGRRGSLASWRC